MKARITNYTFDLSAKTITFTGLASIALESILLITNVTDNIIIYNFADPTKSGTVLTNVLTLTYNTTTMSDSDALSIYYDDGAITSSAANTARTSSTIVTHVQPIDEQGNIIKGGISLEAEHRSPKDFTVTYTSASTITLTGLNFTLENGAQIAYIKVRNSSTNITITYVNGSAGYSFAHSSGVVTAYLNGGAASIFTVNDMYEMGVNDQRKAHDPTTDTTKVTVMNPENQNYVQDSLVDTTNVAAATVYYPSSTGMSMDGFKDMSLTGKFIDADNTVTMTIECTNDEDTTAASWVQTYGFSVLDNAMINSVVCTSTTKLFAIDFDNFNFSYFRIKVIYGDSTNTSEIKCRRK